MSLDLAARALARRALNSIGDTQGADAYEIAIAAGFVGTRTAWLQSLKGVPGQAGDPGEAGAPGKDAYEIAVAAGYVGDRAAWLASLRGSPGQDADPEQLVELQTQLAVALDRIALLEGPDTLGELSLSADQVAEDAPPGTVIGAVLGRHRFELTTQLSDAGGRLIYAGGLIVAGLVGFDAAQAQSHDIVLRRVLAKPGRPIVTVDSTLTVHVAGPAAAPSLDFSKPANSQYLALLEDI